MSNFLIKKNWKHLQNTEIEVAILPWGATEAHNLHLPYGTDTLLAEYFSDKAVEYLGKNKEGIVILPSIPYGVNTAQIDVLCNINMNHSTQFLVLKDIVESLERQSIHKLIIVNSHGGNSFVPIIREILIKFDVFIVLVNTYQSLNADKYFEDPGDHAGEMETSLMMHIHPELVLPLTQSGSGSYKKFKVKSLNEDWCWAQREWLKVTEDNGIGNPALATKEKGEGYIEELVPKLAKLISEIKNSDLNDLYE